LFQIDSAINFFGWVNEQMAVLAYGKISFAPTGDIVQLGGVGGGPAISGFANLGADAGDFSGQFGGLRGGSIPNPIRTWKTQRRSHTALVLETSGCPTPDKAAD
jgi:hypothetical protein